MENIFISYHSEDCFWAELISYFCKDIGFNPIARAWNEELDTRLTHVIDSASKKAEKIIIVLSTDYIEIKCDLSEWISIFDEVNSKKRQVIPVKVENDLESIILDIEYLDFVGLNNEDIKETLLRGLKGEFIEPRKDIRMNDTLLIDNIIPFPKI